MASFVASPDNGAILITKAAIQPLIQTPIPVPSVLANDFLLSPATRDIVSAVARTETNTAEKRGLTPFSIDGIKINATSPIVKTSDVIALKPLVPPTIINVIKNIPIKIQIKYSLL